MFLSEDEQNKDNRDKQSKAELDMLKDEHKFELLTQAQYEHVLARMKKDLIASQLKSTELQKSLKSKMYIQ